MRATVRFGAPSRLEYLRGGWLYVVDDKGAVTIVNISRGHAIQVAAVARPTPRDGRAARGSAYPVMSLAAWTWSCVRPYRGRVAILTTIAVTNVALGVLAPWPLKLVVDNVLEGRPLPGALGRIGVALAGDSRAALLVLVVCGGLLLQVLTQTLSMINVQVQVDTGQRLVYALRARLLAHLQALALRHHVVTRTADSVYRLEADAYCVHDLVMSGLLNLFVSVLTLVAMFVVLLSLDASLALLSLAVVPLLYACLRYYSTRMVDRAQQVKELESRLVDRLYEILSGIKVVKSFAREPHELERFADIGRETMSARLRYTWQESLFTWVVAAITLSGTAVVLAVGGLHVLRGDLTVGGLLVVIAYLASVYGPLSSIAYTTGKLQSAVASSRRVREVLALVPETLDRPDAIDASSMRRRDPVRACELRLRRRASGSSRRQLHRAAGRDGGARRPDRRREVDAGQPGTAVLRASAGPRAHRRHRRGAVPAAEDCASASRSCCRTRCCLAARSPRICVTAGWTPPSRTCRMQPAPRMRTTSSCGFRAATTRHSRKRAAACLAANASGSASRAPC